MSTTHALVALLAGFAGGATVSGAGALWARLRAPRVVVVRDVLTDQPMRGPYTDASGTCWMLLRREMATGHGSQPDTMRLDLVRQNQPGR